MNDFLNSTENEFGQKEYDSTELQLEFCYKAEFCPLKFG